MCLSRFLLSVVILLTTMLGPAAADAAYYVDPAHGHDSGAGTLTRPWKTIDYARTRVAARRQPNTGSVHVYLRGGTYPLTRPVTFTARDSGRSGHDIVYQAYPNPTTRRPEHPVISGALTLTARWSRVPGTLAHPIWKTAVPPGLNFRQIYINGAKATRSFAAAAQVLPDARHTSTGYSTTNQMLRRYASPRDMEVVEQPWLWVQNRLPIASLQADPQDAARTEVRIQNPCWAIITASEFPGSRNPVRLENAYEFLTLNDVPGQWALDTKTHTLAYIPLPGQDITRAQVQVPSVGPFFRTIGPSPVQHLQFVGLTFAYSTWLRPSSPEGLGSQQANQYSVWTDKSRLPQEQDGGHPDAALEITNGRSITVRDCIFRDLGGNGLNMQSGACHNTITGCVFFDCAAGAIQIGNNWSDMVPGAGGTVPCTGITITRCHIHDVCREYQGGCGIFVGPAGHVTIARNEIDHLPYTGISLGWAWQFSRRPRRTITTVTAITAAADTAAVVVRDWKHGLRTGSLVWILGAKGNTAINGEWGVTVIDANSYRLNGCRANGQYTGGAGVIGPLEPTFTVGNVIADNNIHDIVQVLGDGGAIYVLGPQYGGVIQNNRIDNQAVGHPEAYGGEIYLDSGTANMRITGNRCQGCDGKRVWWLQYKGTNHLAVHNFADNLTAMPNDPDARCTATASTVTDNYLLPVRQKTP